MLRFCYFIITLMFASPCFGQTPIHSYTLQGNTYNIASSSSAKWHVFIFLAPECPLSQSYSLSIRKLTDAFKKDKRIAFMLVFSGKDVGKQEITGFLNKYKLSNIEVLVDPQQQLAHRLNATITPQAIVLNGELLTIYSGQIDNWAISLGQKRQVVTAFYLQDALESVANNKPVKVQKTLPVGCFIE